MKKLKQQGGEKVKDQIINLLRNPLTATDLKERLPSVSSMGTIAYHLKNLEESGIVVKEKMEKVRGQPTYYYLAILKRLGFKDWSELERSQQKDKLKKHIKLLKDIASRPQDAFELVDRYDPDEQDDDLFDMIFNRNDKIKLMAEITEEGKRFLKENTK